MTILSQKTVGLLVEISKLGKPFGIETLVLEKDYGIRGKSGETNVFFMREAKYDFLEFDGLCINRVQEFNKRLSYIENINGSYSIHVDEMKETDGGKKYPAKLKIISPPTAIEIGCAHPGKVGREVPKHVKDESFVKVKITPDNFDAIRGMPRVIQNKNKHVNIKTMDGLIVFAVSDVLKESVMHVISVVPEFVNENDDFSFFYGANNILPLFKGDETIEINLTKRGLMFVELGMKVLIFPERTM